MVSVGDVLVKFLDVVAGSKGALPPHRYVVVPEEDNEFRVEPLSGAGLKQVRISGLRASLNRGFLVIDGSSRSFGTHSFKLFITGVAAYGSLNGIGHPVVTYPESALGGFVDVDWGFAGLKAPLEVLRAVEGDGVLSRFIRVRSLEGYYFIDYDDALVSDEVRMGLETRFMDSLMGNKLIGDSILIIDGPIYLAMKERKKLADMRVSVVSRLGEAGVPTIGVVKRVEGSGKLCRSSVIDMVKDEVVGFEMDLVNCNDAALMHRLGQVLGVGIGEALILGPFRISAVGGKLSDYFTEDRVFWYVYTGLGPGVFRIETLESIYRRHSCLIDDSVQWLVGNVDGSGMPYVIDVADYYAKAVTRNLYLRFYQLSFIRGLKPTYDTIQELSRVLGEEGAQA